MKVLRGVEEVIDYMLTAEGEEKENCRIVDWYFIVSPDEEAGFLIRYDCGEKYGEAVTEDILKANVFPTYEDAVEFIEANGGKRGYTLILGRICAVPTSGYFSEGDRPRTSIKVSLECCGNRIFKDIYREFDEQEDWYGNCDNDDYDEEEEDDEWEEDYDDEDIADDDDG